MPFGHYDRLEDHPPHKNLCGGGGGVGGFDEGDEGVEGWVDVGAGVGGKGVAPLIGKWNGVAGDDVVDGVGVAYGIIDGEPAVEGYFLAGCGIYAQHVGALAQVVYEVGTGLVGIGIVGDASGCGHPWDGVGVEGSGHSCNRVNWFYIAKIRPTQCQNQTHQS